MRYVNPYQPPRETVEVVSRAKSGSAPGLLKASKYLTRMGLCSLLYFFPAGFAGIWVAIAESDVLFTIRFLILVIALVVVPWSIILTIAAYRLPQNPDKYLRRLRWYAIVLGTFFFPWFTWPAYIAYQELALYEQNAAKQ